MSSPHVTGSAAVLLGIHPTWTPAQVKSALVNTSDLVVKNAFNATTTVGPQAQGAGRENLTQAANTEAMFAPVSASFGRISGSQTNPTSLSIQVSATPQTYTVTELKFNPATGNVGAFGGGTISTGDSRISSPATVVVPASGSATLTISVNAGLAHGTVVQGWLKLSGGGGQEYQVAYWAQVAP
jgi:hypothetical protein